MKALRLLFVIWAIFMLTGFGCSSKRKVQPVIAVSELAAKERSVEAAPVIEETQSSAPQVIVQGPPVPQPSSDSESFRPRTRIIGGQTSPVFSEPPGTLVEAAVDCDPNVSYQVYASICIPERLDLGSKYNLDLFLSRSHNRVETLLSSCKWPGKIENFTLRGKVDLKPQDNALYKLDPTGFEGICIKDENSFRWILSAGQQGTDIVRIFLKDHVSENSIFKNLEIRCDWQCLVERYKGIIGLSATLITIGTGLATIGRGLIGKFLRGKTSQQSKDV